MRAVSHALLAVVVVAATTVPGAIRDVDTAAATQALNLGVESISPTPDDVVGVAAPIMVTFSKPMPNRLAAERDLALRSTPPMTGKFEWLESNVVQWVPDNYWPSHSTVMLSVAGKRTAFQTGPAVVGVADISDHTFTVTIDGVGAESPIGLPAPHHLPHAGEAGVLLASMGRPEYPTPAGKYTVLSKERSVLMDSSSVGIPTTASDGYLMEVDYAVRITRRGIFVHSAPWAVPSIGFDNTSHGCISLIPAAAEWYFNTANVGDPVIVQE